MFANAKQLAAAGAAVAGVGWMTVVSPGVGYCAAAGHSTGHYLHLP